MPRAADKAKKAAREEPIENADEVPLPEMQWKTDGDISEVPVENLHPHPDNPNSGDVDSIVESMDENGWYGVVTAQASTGRILAGEHRWLAAKRKGALTVPVFWKDCDDVTAIKIMLADNATARRGVINRDKVGVLLEVVGDIRGTGIDQAFLDEVEAADEEQTKKRGETVGPGDVDKLYEPNDDVYASQYGVIVLCTDEKEQKVRYEKALELGWEARVISV